MTHVILVIMENLFTGKRAVVVGGTGGIGREISQALSSEGASVLAIGAHLLDGIPSKVIDLDNSENRIIVINEVQQADILCVVRGPFLQKSLHEMTSDEWISSVYANLALPGMLVSAVLSHMVAARWGRILLFGGTRTDSIRGFRTNAAYASAKTGLSSLVKSVALSYASDGVSCNGICPGFVDTEYLDFGQRKELSSKNPDGSLISVKDIAELAIFLMKNPVFNGSVVPADKGWASGLI
jgi:3-hydroxybutyrate dehydrogenase